MAANTNVSGILEQVSFTGDDGSMHRGRHQEVISGVGATRTLRREESGSLCLFDRAAGVTYTLPAAPTRGMTFDFRTTVTITSNSAKTITGAGTEFLLGLVLLVGGTTETIVSADFNGTSHVAITSNGTTTGGVIGDQYTVTAISATQWVISGLASGSGTVATPAATS